MTQTNYTTPTNAEIAEAVRSVTAIAEGTHRIIHDLASATETDARFTALEALVALMRDGLIDVHVAICDVAETQAEHDAEEPARN